MKVNRIVAGAMSVAVLSTACASARPPEVRPLAGQSAEQLDRDRWECALQAQAETGFDPGSSLNTGSLLGLLAGGAVGAALGTAIGAGVWTAGEGAAAGAIVGGGAGAPVSGHVKLARDMGARDRAFYACLEGRGYAIREREKTK